MHDIRPETILAHGVSQPDQKREYPIQSQQNCSNDNDRQGYLKDFPTNLGRHITEGIEILERRGCWDQTTKDHSNNTDQYAY